MDRPTPARSGSFQATLIDQDIAHIARVMRPALQGDLGGPILPASYWRQRLHTLLDADFLTKGQLRAIDSLLLQLEHFLLRNHPPAIHALVAANANTMTPGATCTAQG
ncbi:hypothetical protein [Paraburkholderia saeva]|uniref:Uncharacterized protein n=1 Tax=Paraburkholderia saeva TaxID=2777537 RepID=A0A9N8RTF9_9BURK|nr:hypothetical protein [Paraburkholderia saeva]CAG4888517.1 hypothetical protein LMG31841_00689 [Paraburkholderia saeva]CAG4900358.1 hypothetical protein R70241_02741 [Paraburkholderia saeva]CAG4908243.1 hypothetical protein R52603_03608 [Paraburkholderia saeva]